MLTIKGGICIADMMTVSICLQRSNRLIEFIWSLQLRVQRSRRAALTDYVENVMYNATVTYIILRSQFVRAAVFVDVNLSSKSTGFQ